MGMSTGRLPGGDTDAGALGTRPGRREGPTRPGTVDHSARSRRRRRTRRSAPAGIEGLQPETRTPAGDVRDDHVRSSMASRTARCRTGRRDDPSRLAVCRQLERLDAVLVASEPVEQRPLARGERVPLGEGSSSTRNAGAQSRRLDRAPGWSIVRESPSPARDGRHADAASLAGRAPSRSQPRRACARCGSRSGQSLRSPPAVRPPPVTLQAARFPREPAVLTRPTVGRDARKRAAARLARCSRRPCASPPERPLRQRRRRPSFRRSNRFASLRPVYRRGDRPDWRKGQPVAARAARARRTI